MREQKYTLKVNDIEMFVYKTQLVCALEYFAMQLTGITEKRTSGTVTTCGGMEFPVYVYKMNNGSYYVTVP